MRGPPETWQTAGARQQEQLWPSQPQVQNVSMGMFTQSAPREDWFKAIQRQQEQLSQTFQKDMQQFKSKQG